MNAEKTTDTLWKIFLALVLVAFLIVLNMADIHIGDILHWGIGLAREAASGNANRIFWYIFH